MAEATGFAILVDRLAESFGQEARRVKKADGATYLLTPDGFLYAFFESPSTLTTESTKGLLDKFPEAARHLVVLCPLAFSPEVRRALEGHGASVVCGERFHHLLENLDLVWMLGEEPPRPPTAPPSRSGLPTAELLDTIMSRAQTWIDWGVPAIALRFLDQALALKPEYRSALVAQGIARLALGLTAAARESFETALRIDPTDLPARLGLARVLGAEGKVAQEISALRALLAEENSPSSVRAHLIAAQVSAEKWSDAIPEIQALIELVPEEARFHALLAYALEKKGDVTAARREERAALSLGMTRDEMADLQASTRRGPTASAPSSSRAQRVAAKSK